jgi:hypothetical protein
MEHSTNPKNLHSLADHLLVSSIIHSLYIFIYCIILKQKIATKRNRVGDQIRREVSEIDKAAGGATRSARSSRAIAQTTQNRGTFYLWF